MVNSGDPSGGLRKNSKWHAPAENRGWPLEQGSSGGQEMQCLLDWQGRGLSPSAAALLCLRAPSRQDAAAN